MITDLKRMLDAPPLPEGANLTSEVLPAAEGEQILNLQGVAKSLSVAGGN